MHNHEVDTSLSFEEQVEQHLEYLLSRRDPENPYKLDGVNYAPPVLPRCVDTLQDAQRFLREGLVVHELTMEDAAARSGCTLDALQRTLDGRPKSLAELLAALEAVGVQAVSVPLCML